MEEQVSPESAESNSSIDPAPSIDEQSKELSNNQPRSNKVLYITIVVVFLLLVGIFLYLRLNKTTVAQPAISTSSSQSSSSTISEKIGNFTKSIIDNQSSPSPSVYDTPQPSPITSSIDEIIITSGYANKEVNYTDNSGPTLDKTNLKIKIPGQQSRILTPLVFAADTQNLYPIYHQNPEISILDGIAAKLGIEAKPSYPDSQKRYYVQYNSQESKLIYDPTAGNGDLVYEAKPGSGDLPTFSQAENLASSILQSIGISLNSLKPSVIESTLSSSFENYSTIHQTLAVNYFQEKDGYPIVLGDVNFFNNNPSGASLSPAITVLITGGGKITRIQIVNYSQYLSQTPVIANSRPLKLAIDELKTYGGHIRNITELEGQKSYFACAESKCDVHDATITSAKINYYWNNSLPALSYSEINDTTPRAFEYLLPVWTFEGTGKIYKSKTDESGKLLPNPNKTDPDQYYEQNVRFIATIPAFSMNNELNLLSLRNYNLTKIGDNQAQVTFDTLYHFPTLSIASFMNAEPRNGIKYRLLVLFPDKTYTLINGYKKEVYQGEINIPLANQKGNITTYLELSDFSNLIEKRTLQVD